MIVQFGAVSLPTGGPDHMVLHGLQQEALHSHLPFLLTKVSLFQHKLKTYLKFLSVQFYHLCNLHHSIKHKIDLCDRSIKYYKRRFWSTEDMSHGPGLVRCR